MDEYSIYMGLNNITSREGFASPETTEVTGGSFLGKIRDKVNSVAKTITMVAVVSTMALGCVDGANCGDGEDLKGNTLETLKKNVKLNLVSYTFSTDGRLTANFQFLPDAPTKNLDVTVYVDENQGMPATISVDGRLEMNIPTGATKVVVVNDAVGGEEAQEIELTDEEPDEFLY